jgi:hypothetical protein
MKMGFLLPNLIRVLALLLVLIAAAYSQNTGTSPQRGTTSQSPSQAQTPTQPTQTPTQSIQTPSQTPSTLPGETQTAPPQPGFGNASPSEAARRVGWGWLVLGLGIGVLIGALAWRRTDIVTREDTRRDRVA